MNAGHAADPKRFMPGLTSRRGFIGGLTSGLLAPGLAATRGDAADVKRKRRKKRKKTSEKPRTRRDATCLALGETGTAFGVAEGDRRFAQTFTALASGPLVRAELLIVRNTDTAGDYILHLGAVDAFGTPTNEVLAWTSVASNGVPDGTSTVSFTFANPFSVRAGTRYALIVTQPGSGFLRWQGHLGDTCPGRAFVSPDQTAPFAAGGNQFDLDFTIFVRS